MQVPFSKIIKQPSHDIKMSLYIIIPSEMEQLDVGDHAYQEPPALKKLPASARITCIPMKIKSGICFIY